jgi:hypothetical protein
VGGGGGPHPDGQRRRPLRLARPCGPHGACRAAGQPRLGARRAGAAHASGAPDRAAPDAAPGAAGPAQRPAAGRWLGPHPWARCHAGPDVATPAAARDRRGDQAPLAARERRGGTRAQLVATDEDPPRVHRLARRRWVCEPRTRGEARVCAEARARPLVPTVGWAWRPQGTPREVMTPGQPTTPSGAGALALPPGTRRHGWGPRPTHAWCRDLLGPWAASSPPDRDPRLSVVVDHDTLPQAQAVEPWLATHPRVTRLCVPTSGPRANPMARAVGDVHDGCPRNHRRQRVPDLVADVDEPRHSNGPWPYTRSAIDDDRAVTTAVETIASAEPAKVAA